MDWSSAWGWIDGGCQSNSSDRFGDTARHVIRVQDLRQLFRLHSQICRVIAIFCVDLICHDVALFNALDAAVVLIVYCL